METKSLLFLTGVSAHKHEERRSLERTIAGKGTKGVIFP